MPEQDEDDLTIPEAALYTGFSEPYVRSLIRDQKLPSTLRPINPGSGIHAHYISLDDLTTFLENSRRRTRRNDSRNKYILYATPVELDETLRVLRAANRTTAAVADLIVPANKLKPKPSPSPLSALIRDHRTQATNAQTGPAEKEATHEQE